MAVPKRKTSRQKTRSRRAHHAIGKPNLVPCKNCGIFVMPHRICPDCGWYKNGIVIEPKQEDKSKESKKTQKSTAA